MNERYAGVGDLVRQKIKYSASTVIQMRLIDILLLALVSLTATVNLKQLPNIIKKNTETSVVCDFSIHKGGPNGPKISGTSLDDELYYKIACKPVSGHCLQVVNCTVSSDEPGFRPYAIIDKQGCSFDQFLFKDVEYPSMFEAGIYNPYPIRFRSSNSSAVVLFCVTTIVSKNGGMCTRQFCDRNNE